MHCTTCSACSVLCLSCFCATPTSLSWLCNLLSQHSVTCMGCHLEYVTLDFQMFIHFLLLQQKGLLQKVIQLLWVERLSRPAAHTCHERQSLPHHWQCSTSWDLKVARQASGHTILHPKQCIARDADLSLLQTEGAWLHSSADLNTAVKLMFMHWRQGAL